MHGAFVGVSRDALTMDDPKKVLGSYRSSRTTIRQFCGRCGSPISWDRRGYENVYICLGLLDGRIAVPKVKNIHTKDKGAYYKLP